MTRIKIEFNLTDNKIKGNLTCGGGSRGEIKKSATGFPNVCHSEPQYANRRKT